MMIKYLLSIILFSTTIYANKTKELDNYLKKWLKKEDSVLLFNYKSKKIIYSLNSDNFSKEITIGSVFKIVTTFLILDNHKEFKNYFHLCKREKMIEGKTVKCWNKKGHGLISLDEAFIHSCNQYFYSLYNKITTEEWSFYAKYLGFKNLKIENKESEIPYIFAGNLTTLKSNIYELANFISIFATNGNYIDLKKKKFLFKVDSDIIIKIKKLMRGVVTRGTARNVFFKKYGFSGKTGTASNEEGRFNGVFIGYLKDYPYAIVVNLYDNIGSNAAKIASDVLFIYTKSEKNKKLN